MSRIESLPKEILIRGGRIYNHATRKSTGADLGIKNGKIIDPKQVDISKAKVIDAHGCIICHGFIDIHAHFREPGREDKETLATGSRAALAGGFTRVCIMPNTNPPIDDPEGILFLLERAEKLPVKIYPIGAISVGQRGEELAEILEMRKAGAIAFSDDGNPVQDGQVLRRALFYSREIDVPIINHAEDIHLRDEGVMNEGALSTKMGLPGNPTIAEATMIHRDLLLAQETNGRLHVPHVSTAHGVDLIRQFKAQGVRITAEATPHHIGLTEEAIRQFNTHAKVAPPLRTEQDRQAVVQGIKDGTIDCIATDHAPHTVEEKEQDIIRAPFGMIGLESAFALAHTVLREAGMTTEMVLERLISRPAKIMNIALGSVEPGHPAELAIVQPDENWTFTREDIYSRSRNTPLLNCELKGRVKATINQHTWYTTWENA